MLIAESWYFLSGMCLNTVYNMLVGHEVGHALFTPNEDWKNLPVPKSYINITEDARIEKLMKRKFPGLAKDFLQRIWTTQRSGLL